MHTCSKSCSTDKLEICRPLMHTCSKSCSTDKLEICHLYIALKYRAVPTDHVLAKDYEVQVKRRRTGYACAVTDCFARHFATVHVPTNAQKYHWRQLPQV